MVLNLLSVSLPLHDMFRCWSYSLLLCGLFYERFVLSFAWCYFVLVLFFFSTLSIAIASLGEERANLSAFRTFVRFALVWFCLFPLPLAVWEGLRLVIVALPGLFFYFFSFMLRQGVLLTSLGKTFSHGVYFK